MSHLWAQVADSGGVICCLRCGVTSRIPEPQPLYWQHGQPVYSGQVSA